MIYKLNMQKVSTVTKSPQMRLLFKGINMHYTIYLKYRRKMYYFLRKA